MKFNLGSLKFWSKKKADKKQVLKKKSESIEDGWNLTCPLCSSKLKKSKIIRGFETLRQSAKCKNCDYSREVILKI